MFYERFIGRSLRFTDLETVTSGTSNRSGAENNIDHSYINGLQSSFLREKDAFESMTVFLESCFIEMKAHEAKTGVRPTRLKAAVAGDLLTKLSNYLGKYTKVMDPLIWELLNCIFVDFASIQKRVDSSNYTEQLTHIGTYFEQYNEAKEALDDAISDISMMRQGLRMKDLVKKFQTVRLAFNHTEFFIRDMCFSTWKAFTAKVKLQRTRANIRALRRWWNRWINYNKNRGMQEMVDFSEKLDLKIEKLAELNHLISSSNEQRRLSVAYSSAATTPGGHMNISRTSLSGRPPRRSLVFMNDYGGPGSASAELSSTSSPAEAAIIAARAANSAIELIAFASAPVVGHNSFGAAPHSEQGKRRSVHTIVEAEEAETAKLDKITHSKTDPQLSPLHEQLQNLPFESTTIDDQSMTFDGNSSSAAPHDQVTDTLTAASDGLAASLGEMDPQLKPQPIITRTSIDEGPSHRGSLNSINVVLSPRTMLRAKLRNQKEIADQHIHNLRMSLASQSLTNEDMLLQAGTAALSTNPGIEPGQQINYYQSVDRVARLTSHIVFDAKVSPACRFYFVMLKY